MVLLRGEENCHIDLNNMLLTAKEQAHFLLTGFSNSRGRITRLEAGRHLAANMKMVLFVLILCSLNSLCFAACLFFKTAKHFHPTASSKSNSTWPTELKGGVKEKQIDVSIQGNATCHGETCENRRHPEPRSSRSASPRACSPHSRPPSLIGLG